MDLLETQYRSHKCLQSISSFPGINPASHNFPSRLLSTQTPNWSGALENPTEHLLHTRKQPTCSPPATRPTESVKCGVRVPCESNDWQNVHLGPSSAPCATAYFSPILTKSIYPEVWLWFLSDSIIKTHREQKHCSSSEGNRIKSRGLHIPWGPGVLPVPPAGPASHTSHPSSLSPASRTGKHIFLCCLFLRKEKIIPKQNSPTRNTSLSC